MLNTSIYYILYYYIIFYYIFICLRIHCLTQTVCTYSKADVNISQGSVRCGGMSYNVDCFHAEGCSTRQESDHDIDGDQCRTLSKSRSSVVSIGAEKSRWKEHSGSR